MELINDLNHVTFITRDIERLIAFYERIFGAQVLFDLEEEGLRHAGLKVGPNTYLHPFQIPGIEPPGYQPMFQRGRIDHFAFNAASKMAFRELHRRLVSEGASDGEVTDMGSLLLFTFTDPDLGNQEVVWMKPGVPIEQGLERANWKTVELD